MTTQGDEQAGGRDRLIDEEAILKESKQVVMCGAFQKREVKLIRGLLTIIDRLKRVEDPEYQRAIWGKDD